MKATVEINTKHYNVDFAKPMDISIPITANSKLRAWYANPIAIQPFTLDDFVGDIAHGATTNFRDVSLNPHGNCTHTECVGHISRETFTVNNSLKIFFFKALLATLSPQKINADFVITLEQIKTLPILNKDYKSIVIRTTPNLVAKKETDYSGKNPTYYEAAALKYLADNGIEHFLTDTPSVDREKDEGKLLAHKAFWDYPNNPQIQRTITEMVFVGDAVLDGDYLLNLQVLNIENDASPSRPVLYSINE